MKLLFMMIFMFLGLLQAQSLKDIQFPDAVVEEVTSIYDGDTFRANIQDYPTIVGYRMGIRIKGIDTPEMRAKCKKEKLLAREAKKETVALLRSAQVIELKNISRGKYFRLVADVYADGVNVGDVLLQNKLAVTYDGGKKVKDWCN